MGWRARSACRRGASRFGNPARFWMELQADFDLEAARKVLTA
jgi:plasmid maintenance system antidote protein VapI